ncbi:MAG: tryptophan--tRNA ligase [Eubacteriales bacterium]|nr:tryptophan--tRNA ligase [Eubacteriales bacterium]
MAESRKNIILTGDRPTGRLHIGHYVGSIKRRVALQNSGEFDDIFILIADAQALTDNAGNPQKIRDNIVNVALDYLSCGLDPKKTTICIQSELPALPELAFYYMNLVTTARLERNPTVKSEIKMRGYDDGSDTNNNTQGIPVGFYTYPISQAADITAFKANCVPVGDDQLPMLEQCKEIVHKFNQTYGDVLVDPKILLNENETCRRLPGTDGKAKMSKSLGNCIYLSDTKEDLHKRVMSMYTDPDHINIQDPGKVEGNAVFTYLTAFANDEHFAKYLPEYKNLDEMKEHYQRGGLGDVKCKKFLEKVLNEELDPIRERRAYWSQHIPEVYEILRNGTEKARLVTDETLREVKSAMMINYFDDDALISDWTEQAGN